jgi:hypothetical protein
VRERRTCTRSAVPAVGYFGSPGLGSLRDIRWPIVPAVLDGEALVRQPVHLRGVAGGGAQLGLPEVTYLQARHATVSAPGTV